MFICPKCGKELEDGTKFCDNCGTQFSEGTVCPNCGETSIAGFAFCQKCGTPLSQAPDPGAGFTPNPGANTGFTPTIDPRAGFTPNPGANVGFTPTTDPGAGSTPNPGANAGFTPTADPGAGSTPAPGASTGFTPTADPGAGYTPAPGANTGFTPTADPGAGYAPNPGANTGFTPSTGTNAGFTPNPNPTPGPAAAAPQQKKGGIPKQAFIFGGIGIAAVALIVALVLIIPRIFGGGGKTSEKYYTLYLKDHEIFYFDLKKDNKLELTSRLLNSSVSDYELADSAYSIGNFIAFSENGNRVFYPDRISSNADGLTLYYRDINKPDGEPVKIDSDITSYAINKAGTSIIYLKGNDGSLYIHDLTEKEKIASNVEGFAVADDCNKVLYLTEDDSLYYWYADKDKVKIASDIYGVEYVSDDLSVVYYIKDEALYKQAEDSEDREKIASDVYRILKIYDSGELYYIKSEYIEIILMDYVNDDLAAADAAITEPEYPDYPEAPRYPYWWDTDDEGNYLYGTDEEYQAAVNRYDVDYAAYQAEFNRLYDEYWEAYYAYWDKESRDSFRETLRTETMDRTQYTLYYYNGTEDAVVTDALTSAWDVSYAANAATLLVPVYNQSEATKVKFSEISSTYEVRELIRESLYSSSDKYVAVQASLTVLDQTDASYFRISSDGSTIYFLDDISDRDEGDLYKITITDGQPGRPELYDTDVSTSSMYFTTGDHFVYYKDVDTSSWKGDLYIDKVEIDYDVRLYYNVSYLGDAVLYYTDWNSEKSYGTLKMYDNGEKTRIADDVHSFIVTDDNDILYLYDYSSNYYKGTLYRYNRGEPVKIDDDVMALIPVFGSKTKGIDYYYGW